MKRPEQNKVIAIDPDLNKSGVACLFYGKLIAVDCLAIWDLFDYIDKNKDALFLIEDSTLIKATWHRGGNGMAKNVGKNQAISRIIIDFCKARGVSYQAVKPSGWSNFFRNAEDFMRRTGWDKSGNEDSRAAVAMLFNMIEK